MQIHADPDPDPGNTLKAQKVEFFYMKNMLEVGSRCRLVQCTVT
jgi:hypothetical protein